VLEVRGLILLPSPAARTIACIVIVLILRLGLDKKSW
jgi:hypothetical protein